MVARIANGLSISANLARRHLTTGQKSFVASELKEHYEVEAAARKEATQIKPGSNEIPGSGNISGTQSKGDSRDHAAKTVGISGKNHLIDNYQWCGSVLPCGLRGLTASITGTRHSDMNSNPYIVVVTNNEDELFLINEFLSQEPFELRFTSSSEECLKAVEFRQPATILFEATEPGLDAREVCAKAKVPMVFLSILDKSDESRTCLKQPIHRYITKPFSPEILLDNVNQVLN